MPRRGCVPDCLESGWRSRSLPRASRSLRTSPQQGQLEFSTRWLAAALNHSEPHPVHAIASMPIGGDTHPGSPDPWLTSQLGCADKKPHGLARLAAARTESDARRRCEGDRAATAYRTGLGARGGLDSGRGPLVQDEPKTPVTPTSWPGSVKTSALARSSSPGSPWGAPAAGDLRGPERPERHRRTAPGGRSR